MGLGIQERPHPLLRAAVRQPLDFTLEHPLAFRMTTLRGSGCYLLGHPFSGGLKKLTLALSFCIFSRLFSAGSSSAIPALARPVPGLISLPTRSSRTSRRGVGCALMRRAAIGRRSRRWRKGDRVEADRQDHSVSGRGGGIRRLVEIGISKYCVRQSHSADCDI